MQYLTQLMSYAKGSLDVVLVMDARSLPKTLDQWMTDVSADADYRHPKCQTGVFVALSPISAQPSGEHVAASAGKQESSAAWQRDAVSDAEAANLLCFLSELRRLRNSRQGSSRGSSTRTRRRPAALA